MNIVIATIKTWNIKYANNLKQKLGKDFNVHIINNKEALTFNNLKIINPQYIFFPHWSWKIESEIYLNYECIVFHMTDLPFGRGGSPLQNLIELDLKKTKISALRVNDRIDEGDVYLKESLELYGTADEILIRASKIIFNRMIPYIVENKITPQKQLGEATYFKRRKPEQSEISQEFTLEKIYNCIRMLDGEGYPKAFIKFGKYKLEFSRASMKNGRIVADVNILEEGD